MSSGLVFTATITARPSVSKVWTFSRAGCDAQRAVQDLSQRLNCTSIGPVALDLRSQYQILRPYSLVSFGGVTFYYAS
ncbi:uncharacterized protein LOC135211558 isoform X3 [Macrobrachium nipponense]|uniref:uncharacterized protein LOC135211558 isoform X3 n=1 Tax=Macrobrachium nipponense TaxID=159736 RepID=UPI0030C82782